MKVYTLRPNLFQRGKFDRYQLPVQRAALEALGVTTVVNMTVRTDYALESSGAVRYIKIPIPDSRAADMIIVENGVVEVVKLMRNRAVVLVHCNGGRNRASLFSARLLMELEGLTGHAAVKELRRLRPNALSNPHFVKYLEGL